MIHSDTEIIDIHQNYICVVGSGPVGISAALELEKLGFCVVVLESGFMDPDYAIQQLSDATYVDRRRHRDMSLAVRRCFGGTSTLWGAGCIPLDPVDFDQRSIISDAMWPISFDDFATYLAAAADYARCGNGFTIVTGLKYVRSPKFSLDQIVRFAEPGSFQKAYRQHFTLSHNIHLYLGSTLTSFTITNDDTVSDLIVRRKNGPEAKLRPQAVVLACGGVETTRLLLAAQMKYPNRFGGQNGPLGRYYMGHLSGSVCDVCFKAGTTDRVFNFIRDGNRHYYKRRITPQRSLIHKENLSNIAFWPNLPAIADASHKSSILSSAYLALSNPLIGPKLLSDSLRKLVTEGETQVSQHLINIAADLPALLAFAPGFVYSRFIRKPAIPGLQFCNRGHKYSLHYHAEHLPCSSSRISLDDKTDEFGLPRVKLDLRFTQSDAEAIKRAHKLLAQWLAECGLGELNFHVREDELADLILDQASDGVHQIGTARMALNAREGVVDGNGKVFDCKNLFVSSSAVFPTSGQANPTFSAIALAVRQARFIKRCFV